MMIRVKKGVEFKVIAPAGFLILQALKTVSKQLGLDLTITSGTDGKHSGPKDPHLSGEAYDVRSKDLELEQKHLVLDALMRQLPAGRFYGFLEGLNTRDEHLHVQRSKGTTFSIEDFFNG